MKKKFFILVSLSIALLCTSCFDDNDDVPQIASNTDVSSFVWRGLNYWYLYKSDVPNLGDNQFSSAEALNTFVTGFENPKTLFESLLSPIDEFSFIVEDYIQLEQAFDGITSTNGMDFKLVRYPNNRDLVFGYVRFVLPNTDAATKGITRGMIFNTINGTQITAQNSSQLLGDDTYTIGLATFDGENISPTETTFTLTKTQYTENPVFIAKTLTLGSDKIGYLMYNSFTANFNSELNAAFAQFKTDNITRLVLDLRYNPGGNTETAKDLASMITGQFTGSIFTTEEWNTERQNEFSGVNLFDTQLDTKETINSLNLSRVHIITTKSSASASELVINGLDPYVTITQVGAATRGKFQASVTVYDSPNFRRTNANLGHTYALQPLVLKLINSAGVTDYFDGLAPDILIEENLTDLGTLGDPNEPLLKAALDNISGTTTKKETTHYNKTMEEIGERKQYEDPTFQRMYVLP